MTRLRKLTCEKVGRKDLPPSERGFDERDGGAFGDRERVHPVGELSCCRRGRLFARVSRAHERAGATSRFDDAFGLEFFHDSGGGTRGEPGARGEFADGRESGSRNERAASRRLDDAGAQLIGNAGRAVERPLEKFIERGGVSGHVTGVVSGDASVPVGGVPSRERNRHVSRCCGK